MAEAKEDVKDSKKTKTWQEKMQAKEPLNSLEETKADADFNVKERMRQEAARKEFEARKRPTN